jgi:hypothetical protein
MKKYFYIYILFITNFLHSQISRTVLDYSINDSKIVRRTCDKIISFETDDGDITLKLYSDSINLDRQTFNLLVCYPLSYKNVNIKLIIQYMDKTEEVVPNFPDIDNCSVYYFLNRLNFIQYKQVKNITFLGVGKFDVFDKTFFIDFIRQLR